MLCVKSEFGVSAVTLLYWSLFHFADIHVGGSFGIYEYSPSLTSCFSTVVRMTLLMTFSRVFVLAHPPRHVLGDSIAMWAAFSHCTLVLSAAVAWCLYLFMLLKLFHSFLCSILAIVVLLCVDCCFCPETVSNARTRLVSPQAVMQADPMTILMVDRVSGFLWRRIYKHTRWEESYESLDSR
jgi:hypothetical protein